MTLPDTSPLPLVTTDPKTDEEGRARLTITGVDAQNPRGFIDGQVYGISFSFKESPVQPSDFDGSNFISLLVFDPVAGLSRSWLGRRRVRSLNSIQHLYPRPHGPDPYAPFAGLPPSHPVVNLSNFDGVGDSRGASPGRLTLPIKHPNHMPVTRDLSDGKRRLLLNWLRQT